MKVLVVNGSPRGAGSNSFNLTQSFLEGLKSAVEKKEEISIEILHVASLKINPCRGCFGCWRVTPGVCGQDDDMKMVISKMVEANVIVYCFPLYFWNVPGILKNLMDREITMFYPFMVQRKDGYGSGMHDERIPLMDKQKIVLISTCGFYSFKGNYDAVTATFGHRYGKDNFTTIFCGQGELFRHKELAVRTGAYLDCVKQAGVEFGTDGVISSETRKKLDTSLYPKDVYEAMADSRWNIDKVTGEKLPGDLGLAKRIAILYNKNAYDGKDRVLEFDFTDVNRRYQIHLGKDGSKLVVDGTDTPTTKIETPFPLWESIGRKEANTMECVKKGLVKISGDMGLMANWDKFFGEGLPRDFPESQ